MVKLKYYFSLIAVFMPFFMFGINVKIENPWLDLQAENNAGEPVISVHCNLTVYGIKGKDFDVVAIIKDEDGNWHKNEAGCTVKTHHKCKASYEGSLWTDLQVLIRHSALAPKSGKHTYQVYLYVYYDDNWYGGVLAGSFTYTNANSQGRNTNGQTKSNSSGARVIDCAVCEGNGIITCLLCNGMGGRRQYRCLTSPPYTSYYEWVPCIACGGGGTVVCTWCNGSGELRIPY